MEITQKCAISAAKTAWRFWKFLSNKSIIRKIFEGEMLFRTQPTILLQIFCEFVIHSQVIFESIIGPEYTCQGDL